MVKFAQNWTVYKYKGYWKATREIHQLETRFFTWRALVNETRINLMYLHSLPFNNLIIILEMQPIKIRNLRCAVHFACVKNKKKTREKNRSKKTFEKNMYRTYLFCIRKRVQITLELLISLWVSQQSFFKHFLTVKIRILSSFSYHRSTNNNKQIQFELKLKIKRTVQN